MSNEANPQTAQPPHWWSCLFSKKKKELPVVRIGERYVFAFDDGNPFENPHTVTVQDIRGEWCRYSLGSRKISEFLTLYKRIET